MSVSLAWSQTEKDALILHIQEHIEQQIIGFQRQLESLNMSIANETKSSAGDKFETAREMLNQEINAIGVQLNLLSNQIRDIQKIGNVSSTQIGLGSLFATEEKLYLLVTALGKIVFKDAEVMIISLQSPFALSAIGKKVGEPIGLAGRTQLLKWIL